MSAMTSRSDGCEGRTTGRRATRPGVRTAGAVRGQSIGIVAVQVLSQFVAVCVCGVDGWTNCAMMMALLNGSRTDLETVEGLCEGG